MTDEVREAFDVTQKLGLLPNLLCKLSSAPVALKGYLSLNGLFGASSLSPLEQQVVLISTSRANGCAYCVAAHSAGLLMTGASQEQFDAIREGRPLADPRLEALRIFTTAVVERRGKVTEEESRAFLAADYLPEQIMEVLLGVAMKTLSNYANHIARTALDTPLQSFAWTMR